MHPETRWKRFVRRWLWVLLWVIFFHYPTNPSLDSLTGPEGDLGKAKALLQSDQFDKGIAFLIPEARSGNAEAQYILARLYSDDYGVPSLDSQFSVNNCEKTYWLDKAARQGHASSQQDLSYAYEVGNGVIQDMKKAYLWRLAAQRSGFQISTDARTDFIAQKLSDEDMKRIKTLFSTWDHTQEKAASIFYLPYIFLLSDTLEFFGINPCGVGDNWLAPIVRRLFK